MEVGTHGQDNTQMRTLFGSFQQVDKALPVAFSYQGKEFLKLIDKQNQLPGCRLLSKVFFRHFIDVATFLKLCGDFAFGQF